MNYLDEIFEKHLKRENLGRIFTGDNEHIRRIVFEFNDSLQFQMRNTPSLPKPNLYVTTLATELSVFVFKEKGHYFIGISIGTIEALCRFFQFLYSQPYFDPECGDITKEKETSLDLSLNPDYLLDYFYNYDLDISPNCSTRKAFAYQVFYKAINYLLLHEYAHISHGHLDYLSRGKLNYLYYEKDTISEGNADVEKALEYDADSAATAHSLKNDTLFLMFGVLSLSEQNLKLNLKELNIAVYFLNKLTELTDINIEDYAHKSHPISDQRTYSHCSLTATFFLEAKSQDNFDVNTLISYGSDVVFKLAMPAYSKMFNKELIDDKLLYFFSKQGLPYMNNVRSKWNIVRNELEKFSYIRIAPEDELLSEEGLYDYEEFLERKRRKNVDSSGEIQ
ncbi:hypothetical protein [Bacillus mycoides]|uniref:hypothetical protein n=1 Tax=Bacillus mycoides TaxID=1405 RepID=UPI0008640651|nr:hypothetical protein [Bacillus mycoides]SCM88411.1 Protein of unknown function [Bacillus mycoides]